MKFKYNYLTNQLSRIDPISPEYSYQIEDQFEGNFGAEGFILGEHSWITFTIYEKKIRVFYKKVLNNEEIQSIPGGEIIYYRRDFAKADIINFEFTEQDTVEKNERGYWISKKS